VIGQSQNGALWINSLEEGNDDAEVEMADVAVSAELTDEDEVAIHATLTGESQSLVSVYLSRKDATALALLLQHQALVKFELERTTA
jgi:hypothetical protein